MNVTNNPFQENITAQNKPVDPADIDDIKWSSEFTESFWSRSAPLIVLVSALPIALGVACILKYCT